MADAILWEQMQSAVRDDAGAPRYERIATILERAIVTGALPEGERLPTVRALSERLGVSGTTVVGAYNALRQKELIRGEVGRGTFVGADGSRMAPGPRFSPGAAAPLNIGPVDGAGAWRRRALVTTELRLRTGHPHAIDLTRGTPDPALLPQQEIEQAMRRVAQDLRPEDLQYPAHPEAVPELIAAILPILEADDVRATRQHIVVGSSAQQFLTLMIRVLARRGPGTDLPVAVEDPGYQTAMDTFERAGCRLVPVAIDQHGMRPEALAVALEQGVRAVLVTPRAHSPTGASWTPQRRLDLAEVLAPHTAVIIEDDPLAGLAQASCGSLRNDPRLAGRVIHIRSFSKSLGPDLRIAVALCDPDLRAALSEEKSFDDGWSSRILQKTLAYTLESCAHALASARDAYAARRTAAATALQERIASAGGAASPGVDGLHVWVTLPPGVDALEVLSRTAARGFLAAPGEPFFVRPGNNVAIRLNAGAATSVGIAEAAGHALADSIDELVADQAPSSSWAITV